MSLTTLVWGLVAIVAGAFFSIYGYAFFRFVLAGIGFIIGFSIAMPFLGGQPDIIAIVIAVVVGGIAGAGLYFLFQFSLYVAGALAGFVVALLISSLLSLLRIDNVFLSMVLGIAGVGLGAFFGPRLGDLIIILATSGVGAYTIVYGLILLFPEPFGASAQQLSGLIPISPFSLSLIAAFIVISTLSQYQILDLRRRLRGVGR